MLRLTHLLLAICTVFLGSRAHGATLALQRTPLLRGRMNADMEKWGEIRRQVLAPIFGRVAIDIVPWGFISQHLNSVTYSGLNFFPTLLGAVLLFDFFTRVMHGVAGVLLEDVWSCFHHNCRFRP